MVSSKKRDRFYPNEENAESQKHLGISVLEIISEQVLNGSKYSHVGAQESDNLPIVEQACFVPEI